MIGRRTSPKIEPVKFSGRVFEFPQGPIMVEAALRRMGSVIRGGEE
ncbi:MAG: hypothetical protein JRD89_15850 [Deltaproteobacteria bacterium]|nr:hypothetical protein [Deltaproteobacteria bacterium]